MGSKTDEVFAQAVHDLRAWIEYLEAKRVEYQGQLERTRRKEETSDPQAGVPAAPDSWMDSLGGSPAVPADGGVDENDSWL